MASFFYRVQNVLFFQGDEAECFYIVESGVAKIMIKSKVKQNIFLDLNFLKIVQQK